MDTFGPLQKLGYSQNQHSAGLNAAVAVFTKSGSSETLVAA